MEHYKGYLQFLSENSQYFGADNLSCDIWDNLPQRHFFYLQQAHGRHVWDIYVID